MRASDIERDTHIIEKQRDRVGAKKTARERAREQGSEGARDTDRNIGTGRYREATYVERRPFNSQTCIERGCPAFVSSRSFYFMLMEQIFLFVCGVWES